MPKIPKNIPVDQLKGVINLGRESEESMDVPIHLAIHGDKTAPSWLVCAVRDAFVPERDAVVDVSEVSKSPAVFGIDVALVLCGSDEEMVRETVRHFAGTRHHVCMVAETALNIPQIMLPSKLGQYVKSVVASEAGPLLERLATTVLESTEKTVSFAANFAFFRETATARLVSKAAARNALMGVADFIPGAGLPLMTMNELNLAFDIAASFGQGLSVARIPEVIFVIAAGFVYRKFSSGLCRAIPSLSLVWHAGTDYAGTILTGRMLADHFSYGEQEFASLGAIEEGTLQVEAKVL